MDRKTVRINDNIRLLSVNTNKFKTAALRISVCLPLTKRNYILSRLLCGMMGRGTRKYPSLELINKRLDDLYASCVSINSTVLENLIVLNISADLLDNRFVPDGTDILGEVLDVISEMIFRPALADGLFPEDKLKHEKQLLKDSFLAKINDPRTYAALRSEELRRRSDENFASLEYVIKTVETVSAEELTSYYRDVLTYAPLRITYVGSESAEKISAKLLEVFGSLSCQKKAMFTPIDTFQRQTVREDEDMHINQSRLVIGLCPAREIDKATANALSVMNAILGGTPSSKLFLNVREKLGLCYSCGSSFSTTTRYLKISAGISAANRQVTESEILRQLDEIKKGNITDAELLAARKSIEFTFDQTYDSPFGIISFYSAKEHIEDLEAPEERKASLLSVTKEDIVAASRLLSLDSCYFLRGDLLSDGETEVDGDE